MNFWQFWSDLSMWNRVGLVSIAAVVVLLIIFLLL